MILEEGGKVEADTVDWRHRDGQGMHGSLHNDPRVSQLVLLICPAIRDWDIGVTRWWSEESDGP